MSDIGKEILALGHSVITKTRLSNAVASPLVMLVVISLPSLIIYGLTKFWPILLLATMPVLFFMWSFSWFMFNKPEMLRTEEHEEKMLQIATGMGSKDKEVSELIIESEPAITATEVKLIEGNNK